MEMSSNAIKVLSVVRDKSFAALWRKSSEKALTWNMIKQEPPPAGCSIEDTYTIITALRHRFSCNLPFDNYILGIHKPDNWFSVTSEMHDQLTTLVAQGQKDSVLARYLSTYIVGQSRLMLLIDEFLSLARRDGFIFRSEAIRSLWNKSKIPTSPEEQLVVNFASLMGHLERFISRKISVGLLEEMHEILLDGVCFDSKLPSGRSRIGGRKHSPLEDAEYALSKVAEIGESKGVSQDIHPIFRSMLISGIFWEFFPFPVANAIFELVVRNLFYLKEGLPVLGWASFSCISEQWEQGILVEPKVICEYLEPTFDCGEGFDATSHFAAELQLMLYELDYLKQRLLSIYQEDENMREVLEQELYLNPRQRDVLLFSLHNPGCHVTISDHQNLYHVVYATARQDLLDLVDMGFLSQFKKGRAFFYEATPRFYEFVKEKTH